MNTVGFLSLVRRERLNSASYTMEMSKLNSLLKSRLFPTGHAYTEIPRWTISIWLSVMSPGVIRTTSLPIILRLRISGVKDSPASRSALKTAEPVHSKGATCTASTSAGTRTAACARGIVYSASTKGVSYRSRIGTEPVGGGAYTLHSNLYHSR